MSFYFNVNSITPSKGDSGGQTINNEDVTITENGEYTAGEGYTGIGTATVNVPTFDIITPKNLNSALVTQGSKVWLENRAAGGIRDITGTYGSNFTLDDLTETLTFANNQYGSVYKSYATNIDTPTEYIEAQVKIKVSQLGTGSTSDINGAMFFGSGFNSYFIPNNPCITISCAGHLQCNVRKASASEVKRTLVSSMDWSADTWYWVKVRITDTSINIKWSLDGINWVEDYNDSSFTGLFDLFVQRSKAFAFTRMVVGSSTYGGIYDLSECYTEIDGQMFYQPYLNTVQGWNILPSSLKSNNSITGFALENIDTNATGNVKTILPSV